MKSAVRNGSALVAVVAVVMTMIGGCGGDDEKKPTAAAKACTAGAKECLDPGLARVCPADESGWLVQRCGAGERCENGDCISDPTVAPCDRYAGSCLDAKTALRCRDNLQGYEKIDCPAGTACQGAGICAGACVVGSSTCASNLRAVSTCADGRGFSTTVCGQDEACVITSSNTSPITTAACKPVECSPTVCTSVCGNKIDPAADQTKFNSTCVSTPEGYRWQLTACLGTQSCSGGCGSTCSSTCVPGTMRCSSDRLGMQTCTANGTWDANVTACNATVTEAALFCMTRPDDPSKVVCGDPICATGQRGTCDGPNFRACGNDGKLAAPAPCLVGSCVASTAGPVGGIQPGTCQAECRAGDERCAGSGFQSCGANGRWGSITPCPASADGGMTCRGYSNAQGRPAKICNASCTPGTRRCTGATLSLGTAAIEECGANGEWGAPANCAVGSCRVVVAGGGPICAAECTAGETVCVGSTTFVPGSSIAGRDAFATCSAQGIPGTPTACAAGTACRKNANGTTIVTAAGACIECVGGTIPGRNEVGLVDRRCSDGSSDAGGSSTHVLSCSDANTWTGPLTSCEAVGRFCTTSGTTGAVCL